MSIRYFYLENFPAQLSVVQASKTDAPAMADLDAIVFGKEAWSVGDFYSELDSADRFYVLAKEDIGMGRQRLVAAVGARLGLESEVLTVATHPDWRRHGLARGLLGIVIEKCKKFGAQEVWIEVRSKDIGAQALYSCIGFLPVGRRPKYYHDDDATIMTIIF